MAVLVTGSSGLLGLSVVAALDSRGADPVAFDVAPAPEGSLPEGVPFVQGTIGNIEDVLGAIVDHQVTRVVSLAYVQAALGQPGFHDFTGAARVNVLGVTNVFEAARLTGVDRVAFASSVGVYGPVEFYGNRAITEDDQILPGGLYGKMKQLNEEIANNYSETYDLDVVVVGPVALLGARSTLWPARLIVDPALGRPAHLKQRSSYRTNAVAVDDVAELFTRITMADRVQHRCYLASGHSLSWGDIADIVRKYVPTAEIIFDENTPPKRTSPHLCDNQRSVNEFGWKIRNLDDAVLKTINDATRDTPNSR